MHLITNAILKTVLYFSFIRDKMLICKSYSVSIRGADHD